VSFALHRNYKIWTANAARFVEAVWKNLCKNDPFVLAHLTQTKFEEAIYQGE